MFFLQKQALALDIGITLDLSIWLNVNSLSNKLFLFWYKVYNGIV